MNRSPAKGELLFLRTVISLSTPRANYCSRLLAPIYIGQLDWLWDTLKWRALLETKRLCLFIWQRRKKNANNITTTVWEPRGQNNNSFSASFIEPSETDSCMRQAISKNFLEVCWHQRKTCLSTVLSTKVLMAVNTHSRIHFLLIAPTDTEIGNEKMLHGRKTSNFGFSRRWIS